MNSISFCKPSLPNFDDVADLLANSMRSGHLSNFGPLYRRATKKLSEVLNLVDKEPVITSSGHTALMTAYSVLGVDKVIVPDYTFVSTLCAAELQGIKTIVSDVDVNTGSFTPEILDSIDEDFDAVVVVCPLSIIPDLKALHDYCIKNNKKMIVDGAATFGSSTDIYSYGDAYCMSFHATKTLSVGEGGAVVLSKSLVDKAEEYITFGLSKNKEVLSVGINAKVSEYTCAILLSLLDGMSYDTSMRYRNVKLYKEYLEEYMLPSFAEKTVYSSLPLYIPEYSDRVIEKLRRIGVQALKYYKPLVGRDNAVKLFNMSVCLPTHHGLREQDVLNIIKTVRSV